MRTVGIEKPFENKESVNPINALVRLKDRGLATSGDYRKFMVELVNCSISFNTRFNHLIKLKDWALNWALN